MMKCEDYREMFLEQNEGVLDVSEQAELQQHLNSCEACQKEIAVMQMIWNDLGNINVPESSEKMALKFQAMLKDFKQAEQPSRFVSWKERLMQLWQLQYRISMAYAILLVAVGIGATFYVQRSSNENQQLQ